MSDREHTTDAPGGITFDKTINLGHVLTFVGFLFVGMGIWSTLDKRVVVLEESRKTQVQVDRNQDDVNRAQFEAVRQSLNDIKRTVERVDDRLRGNPKP
jgi:hypothetical protein